MPGLRATPAVTMQTSRRRCRHNRRTAHVGVEAVDRTRLRDVQRLTLRHAFGDVEQHDVAELAHGGEVGERAANHSGTDKRDLGAGHMGLGPWQRGSWQALRRGCGFGQPAGFSSGRVRAVARSEIGFAPHLH
jgi:hypothetical protein